jgi:hypothetical protein
MDRISKIPWGISLFWEGPLACVWRIIDRKSGRRSQGCADPEYSVPCIRVRIGWLCSGYSVGSAVFYGLSPRIVGSSFQASALACVCFVRARSPSKLGRVPSCAHFYERLGSTRRDHSLTHQRIKTRNFHLINVQTVKALQLADPSGHPSPRQVSAIKFT